MQIKYNKYKTGKFKREMLPLTRKMVKELAADIMPGTNCLVDRSQSTIMDNSVAVDLARISSLKANDPGFLFTEDLVKRDHIEPTKN